MVLHYERDKISFFPLFLNLTLHFCKLISIISQVNKMICAAGKMFHNVLQDILQYREEISMIMHINLQNRTGGIER